MTTVVLVGSLDTKGEEYRYARERLAALGADTVVVDTGTVGAPAFTPDVTAAEVAAAGGSDLERLRVEADRGKAVAAMAAGAAVVLAGLRADGRLDGAFALGGSGNTTVASAAFRALPLGVPKLILSTMTAGNVRGFVGDSDMVLAASVVDIAGLNRISRTVIANAAAAIAGMASAPPGPEAGERPLVAASMIGLTTRAVTAARRRLEELGYEVVVFHMTGAGGATMESLIDQGQFVGVLDLTTSELADELGDGVCSAGPDRLRAAAGRRVPQVVAPGGLDMINFGPAGTVPERYRDRAVHVHNSQVTLVRTDAEESAELGRRLVERVASPDGGGPPGLRPVLLLPTGGFSAIDVAGHAFHDAAADAALVSAVHAAADPGTVRVVTVDGDIDRPEVGTVAADLLAELIAAAAQPAPAEELNVYTVTVLYPQPADPAAFDTYHDEVHVPIASGMRGLTRWTAHRIEARDDTPPPYHMVVQLSAPTREALQEILDSPAGVASSADVPNFATGGAVFLFGEQQELPTAP